MSQTSNRANVEKAVLGGMLRHPPAIAEAALLVGPADFGYYRPHAEVLFDLWQSGKPVDLVGVADEMKRRGALEDRTYAELGDLWDGARTAANLAYHAGLLRDASALASLAQAAGETLRDAESPTGPAAEVLDAALSRLCAVADRLHRGRDHGMAEVMDEAVARIDARAAGAPPGVTTGLSDLDDLTAGLQPSELTVVAARPSVGKTALAVHLALCAAAVDVPVLFCSLEQSRVELAERMLAAEAGVETHRLRQPSLMGKAERGQLAGAHERLRGLPMTIDDAAEQSALRVAAAARRLKARGRLGLVVIDYLQLVAPEDRRAPREQQVAAVSRRLKGLARDTACPVVALSQLNRASEERADGRPRLSDLRESGGIEADADAVWLLSRVKDNAALIDLQVAKNRNGRTGDVLVTFDRARMRFTDFNEQRFAS